MYYFYLNTTLLPVAPEKLSMKIKGKNKTVTLINQGEINLLKTPGLTEVSFECLFPHTPYSFATYADRFLAPKTFLDLLEQLVQSPTYFTFKVVRTTPDGRPLFDTNLKVSLEEYEIKEEQQEGLDLVVSVNLKEYREFGTKFLKVIEPEVVAVVEESRPAPPPARTHTVVKGDCLWNIARKEYGSGASYTKIYDANAEVIEAEAQRHNRSSSSNGHWIYPGTVLVIPD